MNRPISEALKCCINLSVTGIWFAHIGPDDAGWQWPKLSSERVNCQCNFMITRLGLFVKSLCEHTRTKMQPYLIFFFPWSGPNEPNHRRESIHILFANMLLVPPKISIFKFTLTLKRILTLIWVLYCFRFHFVSVFKSLMESSSLFYYTYIEMQLWP